MLRKAGKGILALLTLGMVGTSAQAEVVTSPTQALKLLTEARILAERCGYLSPAQRRELTDLAAEAELITVRRAGAAAASAAVRKGKAAAKACTDEKSELVNAVYEGARAAARRGVSKRQARRERRASESGRKVRQDSVGNDRARVRRVARVSAVGQGRKHEHRSSDVARYRSFATAYYLALKCRNRPQGELMRMWRKVRDMHYATMRKAGGRAVARAKAAAERAARARSCR